MYARPFTLDASLGFASPLLVGLLAYWHEKRGARAMPARADIDPTDMALRPHIGFIVLADVIGRPARFRYRLIGSRITAEVGRDSTGKWLDELYSPIDYENMIVAYRWVVQNRAPLRITGNLRHANRAWLDMESLDLPLSSDGETVDVILTRSILRSTAG
jgi:hypothetical protein